MMLAPSSEPLHSAACRAAKRRTAASPRPGAARQPLNAGSTQAARLTGGNRSGSALSARPCCQSRHQLWSNRALCLAAPPPWLPLLGWLGWAGWAVWCWVRSRVRLMLAERWRALWGGLKAETQSGQHRAAAARSAGGSAAAAAAAPPAAQAQQARVQLHYGRPRSSPGASALPQQCRRGVATSDQPSGSGGAPVRMLNRFL